MADRRLFYASTFFGAMTLAAAIGEGRFCDGHRTLLISNNAAVPEITPSLDETPGFAALRDRFDDVVSWNEIIAPLHPSDWKPRAIEVPMLGRLLSARLGGRAGPGAPADLPQLTELVLESIAVPPSRTLAGLVKDCPITVYSDGLMSYGPTRDPLPREIAGRVTRLLHLDLVPGLTPLLLSEYGVPPEALTGSAFMNVVERVGKAAQAATQGEAQQRNVIARAGAEAPQDKAVTRAGGETPREEAVILGQYLSSLGILTAHEEAGLHEAMLRGLAARGHRRVLFKPHPAAGRRHARELRPVAAELGVELVVAAETTPAEVLFAARRPELVVGCFSTALATARRFFGLQVATAGGDLVLERLSPYENSNRIPATIIDATLPRLAADGSLTDPPAVDVNALVGAVGFCMQSAAHPGLRDTAADYVRDHGTARYFKKRRLESLGLLPEPQPSNPPKPSQRSRLRRFLSG